MVISHDPDIREHRPAIHVCLSQRTTAGLRAAILLAIAVTAAFLSVPAAAQPAYRIEGDGIDTPLTAQQGDPERGRRIVADRTLSACLLCHSGPFPAPHLQGTVGPKLNGVGLRLTEPQLRLRVVDSARLNPDTVMPSYYRTEGLTNVGQAWQGKPILTAQQIEDVVAFLATLRAP